MSDTYEIDLTSHGDGRETADIRRNRRAFRYSLEDLDEAMQEIRRIEGTGFAVTVIEPDGYRRKALT